MQSATLRTFIKVCVSYWDIDIIAQLQTHGSCTELDKEKRSLSRMYRVE